MVEDCWKKKVFLWISLHWRSWIVQNGQLCFNWHKQIVNSVCYEPAKIEINRAEEKLLWNFLYWFFWTSLSMFFHSWYNQLLDTRSSFNFQKLDAVLELHRDKGLAVFMNKCGPESEKIKKTIESIFWNNELRIIIQYNLKIVNYLDVTFNLTYFSYRSFSKTNNETISVTNQTTQLTSLSCYLYL